MDPNQRRPELTIGRISFGNNKGERQPPPRPVVRATGGRPPGERTSSQGMPDMGDQPPSEPATPPDPNTTESQAPPTAEETMLVICAACDEYRKGRADYQQHEALEPAVEEELSA